MHPRALTCLLTLALAALADAADEAAFAPPAKLVAQDARDDAGGVLFISWPMSASESHAWDYVVWAADSPEGKFKPVQRFPSTSKARRRCEFPQQFGFSPANKLWRATKLNRLDVSPTDRLAALRAEAKNSRQQLKALTAYRAARESLRTHREAHGRAAHLQEQLEQLRARLDNLAAINNGSRTTKLPKLKEDITALKATLSQCKKLKDAADAAAQACEPFLNRRPNQTDDFAVRLANLRTQQRKLTDAIAAETAKAKARPCYFRLGVTPHDAKSPGAPFPGLSASATAKPNWFKWSDANTFVSMIFLSAVILGSIAVARRKELFLRKIAGLDAVDEALGRATEMGKPVLFVHGLSGVNDVAVIASVNILGRMARRVAEYDTGLLVVNNDPVVYSLSSEVVREGYVEAGRPDRFREDDIYMVASRQFPYVAAVAGIMAREQPAANFFMGYFFAESLILAEAGAATGAIQIAATDAFTQLPFFVTTCDYTLMGEELYAASAYLSREPKLMGTLRGQDIGKAVLIVVLLAGAILLSLGHSELANLLKTF